MLEDLDNLTQAARQLLAIEDLLGAPFLPASRNPLPEVTLAAAPARTLAPGRTLPPLADNLTPDQKAHALAELEATLTSCARCALCKGRTNLVFGEGSPAAELMFVGEGPGAEEDATGRPFVGRAGQLLMKMLTAMGLSREQVYIANLVKCRPPGNRTPLPEEVQSCMPMLLRQIQIIRPRVIVTLGAPATRALLDTKEGITNLRGNWQALPALAEGLEGLAVMPTFHPSFVLRRYTPEVRGQVWNDLRQVMDRLGLPTPGGA